MFGNSRKQAKSERNVRIIITASHPACSVCPYSAMVGTNAADRCNATIYTVVLIRIYRRIDPRGQFPHTQASESERIVRIRIQPASLACCLFLHTQGVGTNAADGSVVVSISIVVSIQSKSIVVPPYSSKWERNKYTESNDNDLLNYGAYLYVGVI